jgi:CheY-like chemotaxis protein
MNGILGNIELLEDQGIVNENTEHLARSAAEMMYLVDSILNYAQLQAGNLQADRSLFSIKSVIEPLAIFIRSRCEKKGIKFTLDILSDLPEEVWGDKQKIQKILEILLSNAVRFTADGEVRLVVDALRTRARDGQRSPVYSILFNVMDTGQGISIEDRQKLFRPFSQTDGSFKRQYGGLGLGLATCHRFAQLMRGTLLFISEINAGSQFNFIIDLEAVETVSKLTTNVALSTPTAIERDATRILIVEDNVTNQMVLQAMLKKLGFSSITAENGLQALQILENNSFDLILMDCQMPEMDGFETTQQIRKTCNGQASIPIIAVTANAMDGDREKCLRAGMNDYMKKPINRALLEEMLERWIP